MLEHPLARGLRARPACGARLLLRHVDHGDLVGSGLRDVQPLAVRGERHVDRRGSEAFLAADGDGLEHRPLFDVEHGDVVTLGDGDVRALTVVVDDDAFGVGELGADRDLLDRLRRVHVDEAHRARCLVRDEAGLAVRGDRRRIRVRADRERPSGPALGVDDRGAIGEVERHQQALAVLAHGQPVRPRELLADVGGREVLGGRRAEGVGTFRSPASLALPVRGL